MRKHKLWLFTICANGMKWADFPSNKRDHCKHTCCPFQEGTVNMSSVSMFNRKSEKFSNKTIFNNSFELYLDQVLKRLCQILKLYKPDTWMNWFPSSYHSSHSLQLEPYSTVNLRMWFFLLKIHYNLLSIMVNMNINHFLSIHPETGPSTFTVVMPETSHRHFEVGCCLIL